MLDSSLVGQPVFQTRTGLEAGMTLGSEPPRQERDALGTARASHPTWLMKMKAAATRQLPKPTLSEAACPCSQPKVGAAHFRVGAPSVAGAGNPAHSARTNKRQTARLWQVGFSLAAGPSGRACMLPMSN